MKLKVGDTEVARIGLGTNRLRNTPANVAFVKEALIDANKVRREAVPASELTVASVCIV